MSDTVQDIFNIKIDFQCTIGENERQLYVTNSGPGEGLIVYGNVIIPFIDKFPKDTMLYKIMTTKPEETEVN